ncbi:MAG TPA: transposase [Kiritimatiellia bacterium]|nr:transposase [Kiritimatiellia bacterium]HRZ12430.1 transposase [Kiritimatiellia bacterium]HSA17812.1 transposase [Kiritimatiellia bacterium]
MARPPRNEFENALYHVTSRGNARQVIFHTDGDRRRFLLQLQDNLEQYGVVLYAWVLMSNHYHLVVRTPRANLGRFMQRLNSSYSLYYRYKHAKTGHAFGGRYKAPLVESGDYLLALTRYVHLNPVKTRAAKEKTAKERIRMLEEHPWSSYPDYVGSRRTASRIDLAVLQHYGRSREEAQRRYRAYAQAMVAEDDEPLKGLMARSTHAWGSEEFVEKVEKELLGGKTGRARDADVQRPWRGVEMAVLDEVVARAYGIEAGTLKRHGRSAGEAKAVAVELASRWSGRTQREIGAHYGGISGQAVHMIRRRLIDKKIDWPKLEEALA